MWHWQGKQPEDLAKALIVNQNFPLMAAWKEQTEEEYLVVTEHAPLRRIGRSNNETKSSQFPREWLAYTKTSWKNKGLPGVTAIWRSFKLHGVVASGQCEAKQQRF